MKSPAFQFYAQDFLVGTAIMSAEEVGGYIRLLCYQWTHGSIPNDDAVIMRLAGCGGNAMASIRHKFGINVAGNLENARLEEVRKEQEAYRAKQAGNAKKRWEKRNNGMGGNAKPYAVAMPSHMPNTMPNTMPKSCSSSSPSSSEEYIASLPLGITEEKKPKTRPRDELLDALVTLSGGDPAQVTSPAFSLAAKALKDIKAVSPDVTPKEIRIRANRYKLSMPGMTITPTALAKHWHICAAVSQETKVY